MSLPKAIEQPTLVTPDDLFLDEKVWLLRETIEHVDRQGWHRFQAIWVVRNDRLTKFIKDMGPQSQFSNNPCPLIFWGGFEYSVGEAMEIADMLREGKMPEEREPTDLVGEWMKLLDEKRQWQKHRSVVGLGITIQRS